MLPVCTTFCLENMEVRDPLEGKAKVVLGLNEPYTMKTYRGVEA
jgi:hypothetical protein